MSYTYEISDELKQIQNILVKNTISQNTNLALLQSEEAIREVYKQYADKIKNVGNKLFNANNLYVSSRNVITKEYFDELFQDVYNDLHALYLNIKYIDDLLDKNLERNKKVYNTIEKRITSLENKLDLARLNVNSIVAFNKVFFEDFNNQKDNSFYYNTKLDKKTGKLVLRPVETKLYNNSYSIKSVSSTTYPVENEDGGVINTTNYLNTFDSSYNRDGLKDMLKKGLWKEQIFTNEIPELNLTINKNTVDEINIKTQGIVSYVDIEFNYLIDFNTLMLDLFGEFNIAVLNILVKENKNDTWKPIKHLKKDKLGNVEIFVDDYKYQSEFNIMQFYNIELCKTKFLRIIFNQKNYTIVQTSATNIDSLSNKINKDLSERRLNVLNIDTSSDAKPAVPTSYTYDSFYSNILNIVDNSSNVNDMLIRLIKEFDMSPKLIDTKLNKTLKYELGTWSIEPKNIKYTGKGKYVSNTYEYTEKPIMSISLTTKQVDIKSNTCNWYISDSNNKNLKPIIPNDEVLRKESINVVNNKYYTNLGYTDGTIIQLDFPIQMNTMHLVSLYEDGKRIDYNNLDILLLNSTMLYIKNIKNYSAHNYVINYIPSKYNIVNIYTLYNLHTDGINLEYNIVAPRKSILKLFLDKEDLNENYTIKRTICTDLEYHTYFSNDVNNLCISSEHYNNHSNTIDTYLYANVVSIFKEIKYIIDPTGISVTDYSAIPLITERVI